MKFGDWFIVSTAMVAELTGVLFKSRRSYTGNASAEGKVILITGATTGLGKEAALQFSRRGARIIMGNRDLQKTELVINEIKKNNTSADIYGLKLDLASLKSVREFAKSVKEREGRIDILINNAGAYPGPYKLSEDGFEMQLAVNYLGHFLLTLHLLPLLRKSSDGRIINYSTTGQPWGEINFDNINLQNNQYTPIRGHLQSKLANMLFTRELAKRLGPDSAVKSYIINPSIVYTRKSDNRFVDMAKRFYMLPIEKGTNTIICCALDEKLAQESGRYYDNCERVDRMISTAVDDEVANRLWQLTANLVHLEEEYRI